MEDYRVYVDLTLNSRRPDFANRMISMISLGVLAVLASISLFSREIMPMPINSSRFPVPDRFYYLRPHPHPQPTVSDLTPSNPTHPTNTLTPIEVKRSTR